MFARKLRRAASFSGSDWRLVADAAVRLARVRLALRRQPFTEVRAGLAPRDDVAGRAPGDGRITQIARAVDIAARNSVPPATCLPRSLVLQSMLAREGVPAELRIGVRRTGAALEAHAWVESDGRVVGDRADIAAVFEPLEPGAAVPPNAVPVSARAGAAVAE